MKFDVIFVISLNHVCGNILGSSSHSCQGNAIFPNEICGECTGHEQVIRLKNTKVAN